MKIHAVAGSLLCLLLLSSSAHAGTDDGFVPRLYRLELGAYGGEALTPDNHAQYLPVTGTWAELDDLAFGLGLRAAFFPLRYIGAEAEGQHFWNSTVDGDRADQYGVRGHLIGQLPGRLTPFLVLGGGGVLARSGVMGNDDDPSFHWGIGGKYHVNDSWLVRVDARHVMTEGQNQISLEDELAHYFEILVGVSFTLMGEEVAAAVRDGDGDGFNDADDRCPTVAGVAPDGCPPADADGDGFAGDTDACPDVAGVAPDGCPPADTDGDGVVDSKDACPKVAAKTDTGCPPAAAKPAEPANPDPDGDGIEGSADACPDEAETKNGYEDEDGCPDEVPEAIQKFSGTIEGIRFASGKSEILAESYPILDRAAALLAEYPKVRVEVGGYTDSSGAAAYNIYLSQQRANAVRDYLIRKGIAAERLEAVGYGPDAPVAPNDTAANKALNRRIEFKLLSTKK